MHDTDDQARIEQLVAERTAGLEARMSLTREELATTQSELERQRNLNTELGQRLAALDATLEHERRSAQEKLALVDRASDDPSEYGVQFVA